MKPIEYLLFFCNVFSSMAEKNVTLSSTTEAPGNSTDPMESRESNITLTLVLANLEEALPTPEPLVGTFPHDFDLTLPRVSRRSYEGMQGQAHSFEEQGAVFVSPGLKPGSDFLCQSCPRATASGAAASPSLEPVLAAEERRGSSPEVPLLKGATSAE